MNMTEYTISSDGKTQTEIIEDSNQKITKIYDNKYRIRDFFTPSIFESICGGFETPLSLGIFCGAQIFTDSPAKALAYAAIPQAVTYIGARALELLCKTKNGVLGEVAEGIRNSKLLSPRLSKIIVEKK